MGRHSAKSGMNILINLDSFLLCEALGRLMDNELEGQRVLAANLADKTDSFLPDKILVDAGTISQGTAIRWPDAKIHPYFQKDQCQYPVATRPARP